MDFDPRSNDPRTAAYEGVFEETKKPKKSRKQLLSFMAGFLVAAIIASGIAFALIDRGGSSVVMEPADAPLIAITGTNLSLVRSTDVNSLRLSLDEVSSLYITARYGSVNVQFHDEDFILANSSQTATHTTCDETGEVRLESRFGNFTIKLPRCDSFVLDSLCINSRFGSVSVNNTRTADIMTIGSLAIDTRYGGATLVNLIIPGVFDVETRFGNINMNNIASNPDTTRLYAGDWGRIVAN